MDFGFSSPWLFYPVLSYHVHPFYFYLEYGEPNTVLVSLVPYSVLALSLNLVWTYWLAHGIGRSFIDKLLKRFKYRIPELPPNNLTQWAIILRLTPGIPFIFTNYALGLLKIPFSKYLLVSIPIVAITDCGFVLASAGIFGGSWKFIWSGVSILIIMILIGRTVSKKQNNADKSI